MMTMSGHAEEEEAAKQSLLVKKSRGMKRVSFPPDEEMVSGFAEIKDAHQDGNKCSITTTIRPHSHVITQCCQILHSDWSESVDYGEL